MRKFCLFLPRLVQVGQLSLHRHSNQYNAHTLSLRRYTFHCRDIPAHTINIIHLPADSMILDWNAPAAPIAHIHDRTSLAIDDCDINRITTAAGSAAVHSGSFRTIPSAVAVLRSDAVSVPHPFFQNDAEGGARFAADMGLDVREADGTVVAPIASQDLKLMATAFFLNPGSNPITQDLRLVRSLPSRLRSLQMRNIAHAKQ